MPLPLPRLDNLRYDRLVSESLDLLPYRAPQWTDYNAHDPGITLLELFAWISENNSYRLDRITPAAERAFLRLLGFAPKPARAALAVVALQPTKAAGAVRLPPRIQIADASGTLRFQTLSSVRLVEASIASVLSKTSAGWAEFTSMNGSLDSTFLPFGESPEPGDAVYFGFDGPLAESAPISHDPSVNMFVYGEDPSSDYETWLKLREEYRCERRKNRGGCNRRSPCAIGLWSHYGVTVGWEFFDGTDWRPLDRLRDATRSLSLSGPVRFLTPAPGAHKKGGAPGDFWFIRCRIQTGRYDCPPRIRGARVNAVIARHAADNAPVGIGKSNGHAWQRFVVSDKAVVPGSTRLELKINGTPQSGWEEKHDFDRSGSLARHYVVQQDGDARSIVFGDGHNGFVPETGAVISSSWQTGSGLSGNASANALSTLPAIGAASAIVGWSTISSAIVVEQPLSAFGGADEETLAATKAHAARRLGELRCAVVLGDFERLACSVPGVPVVRARAVAEFHPGFECLPAAGCIAVVVITKCARRHPEATEALCRAVQLYLDSRRPVAVEVRVTGPQWTHISVRARLRLRSAANATAVRAEAIRRIDAFLDPLTGGPDRNGWPIGRTLYRSEIYALLHEIAAVASVSELALKADDNSFDLCNNLDICPHGMPLPGTHDISTYSGSAQ